MIYLETDSSSFSISSIGRLQYDKNSYRDNNNSDLIYINQNLENLAETTSTHLLSQTTHLPQVIHVKQQQPIQQSQQQLKPRNHRVSAERIRNLAHTKFENTGRTRGLTIDDLVREGPYKCVDTKRQAQDTIHNHKKAGNLYPRTPGTKPQQYFATEDEAKVAVINSQRNTQLDPSEVPVRSLAPGLNRNRLFATTRPAQQQQHLSSINHCLEELKANNFLQALLALPSIATKWHNHRYEFCLLPDGSDPPSAPYHDDRLAWIKPNPQNNQAKTLPPTYICGYEIKVDVYPNDGKVIIAVPSSECPLPFPNTEELANEFLIFLGEIKYYIERCLSDKRGVLVPSPLYWYLVHADINKDVPCSPELFLTFQKMQMIRADGVFRAYARMSQGHCVFRFEKGNHVFNQTIEQVIGSLVKEVGAGGE
jgi:hypothetical protein